MKKFLCILLSTVLVITCILPAASAADSPDLKFAVASDLHYNIPREKLEGEIDDEIYWYANRRGAMEDESGFIIDEFLNQCAEDSDCEFVLISGDLADNGKHIPQEHYAVAQKLAAFEKSTGKQVFVIDGNHDLGEGTMTDIKKFKEIYAEFGYDKAIVKDEETCSYTADLGDKYRLIAFDSCEHLRSTDEDGITAERLDWVHKQADAAKADGRYPILMMHHNLLDHMPLQRVLSHDFIVRFHYTTAELCASWGIKLVFTGHEHCSDGASYTSTAGNTIYDFATTSLTMHPLQYRMVSLTDNEIKYEAKTVDSIDTDALSTTVSGYSDAQLSLMNSGLNSYSKGFLKKGIEYRFTRALVKEKLGMEEGEPFYKLVNTAVTGLTDILDMPLYGEGSASELAEKYGIDIPQSNYKNGWDVVTELIAAHFEGGESKTLDSTEITILLRTLTLILRDDISNVSDEVFLSVANALLGKSGTDGITSELTQLATSVFGPVTDAEYFLLALVSPLLYEFAFDNDNVDDNNGVIPGYAVNDTVSNLTAKVNEFFTNITLYLSLFFKYFTRIFGIIS